MSGRPFQARWGLPARGRPRRATRGCRPGTSQCRAREIRCARHVIAALRPHHYHVTTTSLPRHYRVTIASLPVDAVYFHITH